MATKVKNVDYVASLAALGYPLPPGLDTRGNTHGEFKDRIINYLASGGQGTPTESQIRAATALWTQVDAKLQSEGAPTASDLLDPIGHFFGSAVKGVGGAVASVGQYIGGDIAQAWSSLTQAPSVFQGKGNASDFTNLPSFRPQGVAPAPAPPSPAQGPQFDDSLIAGRAQTKTGAKAPIATAPAAAKPTPTGLGAVGAGLGAGGGAGGGASNQPPPPSTWNDDQIRTFIKQNFGSNAYFVDIPEVWDALKGVVKSGKGINGLEPALEATAFWKGNGVAARSWYVKEKADPAQAAADIAQQTQAIQAVAQQAGITLDPIRASQMAQSYLRYGWTQTDLQRAIGAEWHYDPATKNQAAAVTKMKADAKNWLVPLSDEAIQTWGQGIISGTTTDANFQQYLRDSAKSLMPQLSNLIDTHAGDPNFTVKTFADPYAQHAANLLGIQSDQVDLADPSGKWRRALDLVDAKTGERRIMSLSEWDSTIKTDPTYGYDKTTSGVNEAMGLATQLKQSLGF
jgi:hypothetical protein